MIVTILYNTAPNYINDWISRPEVLQTVLVYATYQSGLRSPEDGDSMDRPLKYQY